MSIPFLARKFQQLIVLFMVIRLLLEAPAVTFYGMIEGVALTTTLISSFFILLSLAMLAGWRHPLVGSIHIILFGSLSWLYQIDYSLTDLLLVVAAIHLYSHSLWPKEHLYQYIFYKSLLIISLLALLPIFGWDQIDQVDYLTLTKLIISLALIAIFTFRPKWNKLIIVFGSALLLTNLTSDNPNELLVSVFGWFGLTTYLNVNIDSYHIPTRYRSHHITWFYTILWLTAIVVTNEIEQDWNIYSPIVQYITLN